RAVLATHLNVLPADEGVPSSESDCLYGTRHHDGRERFGGIREAWRADDTSHRSGRPTRYWLRREPVQSPIGFVKRCQRGRVAATVTKRQAAGKLGPGEPWPAPSSGPNFSLEPSSCGRPWPTPSSDSL